MDVTGALVVVLIVQSVVIGVLCCSVPFLFWKVFREDSKIETLDEAVSTLLEIAGIHKGAK